MAKYIYPHLIKENIAPPGAVGMAVYHKQGDTETEVYSTNALGGLKPPSGFPLYSFGLISDTHIMQDNGSSSVFASQKLENALNWYDGKISGHEDFKVDFVCHCGDVTNHGLFVNANTGEPDLLQFAEYQRICNLHPNLPIYCTFGNHDSYNEQKSGVWYGRPLTYDLDLLETYTGLIAEDEHGAGVLHYRVDHEGDVFLFAGHTFAGTAMSDESYTWLTEQINTLNGKRCFIFVHPFFSGDSGHLQGVYNSSLLDQRNNIKALLRDKNNVMLFHGHSHLYFDQQKLDSDVIYSYVNGFHSVHVPSLVNPTEANSTHTGRNMSSVSDSGGYIVDVYPDYVILKGRNFGKRNGSSMINPSWDAHGTYKIDIAQP